MDNTGLIALCILWLLGLNVISHYKKSLILPEVVWILIGGLLYGIFYHHSNIALPDIVLSPEVILFGFVPVLIFANARSMCLKHLKKVLFWVGILSTLGFMLSSWIISAIMYILFDISWLESLLFGVIVSATDPLAVSALLKSKTSLSSSKVLLIEWESILNDGIAVTAFSVLTTIIFFGGGIGLPDLSKDIFWNIFGAACIGFLLAKCARMILEYWHESNAYLQVNMGLVIAYGGFLLAESLHTSGIIAVFVGALTYAYKPRKQNNKNRHLRDDIWNYFEFLVDGLLFFILGAHFSIHVLPSLEFEWILAAIAMLLLARWTALLLISKCIRIDEKSCSLKDIALFNFVWSRWAISIALILILPGDYIHRDLFLSLAYIMVIVSILVYPFIVRKILK
jgi:monovalent cation:H+ antiporter, CPA1 family